MKLKKIKSFIFNLTLIPVLLLAGLFFVSIARSRDTEIDYAKKLIADIKHLRNSIDKYYLETGEFPNLTLEGAEENLEIIKFKFENGKEVSFKDIYGAEILTGTPEFNKLNASNKVYGLTDFKEATNIGGWNYNKKTGEIHANLPYNFFEQSIEWSTF
ncbi:MAG: hypothetical protein IJG31_04790 [Fusobacterium sp.]|nr:hypothetical protein [Fusobacterium sp.]